MLTSLDWSNCRYTRLNQKSRGSFKDVMTTAVLRNGRLLGCGHCTCRWPLLVTWTLVVIFVLYRAINYSDSYKESHQTFGPESQQALRWPAGITSATNEQDIASLDSVLTIKTNPPDEPNTGGVIRGTIEPVRSTDSMVSANGLNSSVFWTTKKSPVSEYARQSEIFILIIQDPDNKSKTSRGGQLEASSNLYPADSAQIDSPSSKLSNDKHKPVIPPHIKLLTEILESHRISYTIDTTRHGMPSQLLEPQRPKQFSVIIIDDFVKYTKLNRWLRDQLDRHCRTNQIGVITYLIDNNTLHQHLELRTTTRSSSRNVRQTSSDVFEQQSTKFVPADLFPLTFEPIQVQCRNNSATRCLINYQLNDKAKLLRILKSRRNFIIEGQIRANSVVAMSSNHVTYEPLTWAKLRSPTPTATKRHKRLTLFGRNKMARVGVRPTDHHVYDSVGVRMRAVVPSIEPAKDPGRSDDEAPANNPGDRKADAASDMADPDIQPEPRDDNNQSRPADDRSSALSPLELVGSETKVLSMLDQGLYDDIRRVIFGISNEQWLDRALLLDAIEHLSSGEIMTPLDRYIQIDIDDIFVGTTGTRLQRVDVEALIEAQSDFSRLFEDGFQFQLGFSGKYFKHGNEAEQRGDDYLIENAHKFAWFCHFWSHSKAHLMNDTETIAQELRRNLEFAQRKNLVLVGHAEPLRLPTGVDQQMPATYAVAPHHSGVYPVHEQLYDAWRSVLNVQATSTEEYPHLRPANRRRGFVHKAIKVLPRQTCGLYTHTIFKDKYPGGFGKLLASIRGGELFQTVLHNPVNIYMTHMSNYANDRLGLLTFSELFSFIRKNTNLRLRFAPRTSSDSQTKTGPLFLADYYFSLHPEETEPLWTNPCDDKRHLAIWSPNNFRLRQVTPKLLIVGPQKTGTTALQSFLKLNPSIRTSQASAQDFEEVQFFNDKHYLEGVHWYFERFVGENATVTGNISSEQLVYLDKSATYFDDPKAPRRAAALLPEAHVVILLINPADRAYSWYQHIRAHGDDQVANEMTFDEVIMFQDQESGDGVSGGAQLEYPSDATTARAKALTTSQVAGLRSLRARCLQPGHYARHLLRWLDHFASRQVVIIDGEWLKYNPVAVLKKLQTLLRLPQQVDYARTLVYSESKGFYCERGQSRQPRVKCLGSSKGRRYGPMSETARRWLSRYYWSHDRQLARLLYEIGQPLPTWLDESINSLPANARKNSPPR